MRAEVMQLIAKGRLPDSKSSPRLIMEWQQALERIGAPLSNDEAAALTAVFPTSEDECFGLAWTLLHLIETAEDWPIEECLRDFANPWICRLRKAAGL